MFEKFLLVFATIFAAVSASPVIARNWTILQRRVPRWWNHEHYCRACHHRVDEHGRLVLTAVESNENVCSKCQCRALEGRVYKGRDVGKWSSRLWYNAWTPRGLWYWRSRRRAGSGG